MATIKVLGKKEIAQVTDMKKVIACVEDVYCQKAKGETVVWPTTFYEFNPGHADMDIKSGYLRGAGIFGHKTVSWFGDNGSKGLPELAGAIMVFSAHTGMPLGVLDGGYITGIRTGAAGAIGAKYLARKDSKHLLVVGSGNQALYQIAAMLTVFPGLERITVANPLSAQYAQEFVDALPGRLERELGVNYGGVALSAAESPEAALADSDIVITVTPSKAPLIKKEWVKPGTHFSCIGADAEGKEEIAPQIMAGAKIFVGDMSHCVAAGEVEVPIKKRIISEADIIGEIGQLILGERQGRISDSDITIYDATGMALLDLAAAKAARGVATISSGNHGSSVSYAASLLGIQNAEIIVPETTPRSKIDKIKYFGAKVLLIGKDYDEAHALGMEHIRRNGMTYIDPYYDDPKIYGGQGTIGMEILEQNPEIDTIVVPIGGGALFTGIAVAVKALKPSVRVVGIQTEACPAMICSYEYGKFYTDFPCEGSLCDALVGGVGALSYQMAKNYVDDFIAVSEDTFGRVVSFMAREEKYIVEAGSCTTMAAVMDYRERVGGAKTWRWCSQAGILTGRCCFP